MADSPLDNFGMVALLRRECAGKKQKDFAVELGISEQYLSDIMSFRRDVTPKIAARYGYEQAWVKITILPITTCKVCLRSLPECDGPLCYRRFSRKHPPSPAHEGEGK
jgi:transcriptional regulator with XRE-family HTH domain